MLDTSAQDPTLDSDARSAEAMSEAADASSWCTGPSIEADLPLSGRGLPSPPLRGREDIPSMQPPQQPMPLQPPLQPPPHQPPQQTSLPQALPSSRLRLPSQPAQEPPQPPPVESSLQPQPVSEPKAPENDQEGLFEASRESPEEEPSDADSSDDDSMDSDDVVPQSQAPASEVPSGPTPVQAPSYHVPVPAISPPPHTEPPKVDGLAEAMAKFFRRVGTTAQEVEEREMERQRELEREEQERENERAAKEREREAIAAAAAAACAAVPEVWPKRKSEEDDGSKPSPKGTGLGLPPPGTVTKKAGQSPADPETPSVEDEEGRVQEISPLDHRFVGLVIGKAGETIKSFKKQSGASIEIDQDLPMGIPRVLIYRGTRKQVALAKKLVENLVQRAKDDEKGKTSTPAAVGGMGILGRGEQKEGGDRAPRAEETKVEAPRDDAVAGRSETLPWRRTKTDEELNRPERRAAAARQPWKREKEPEAAPTGSLTGMISGETKLGMRPAWMKPTKEPSVFDVSLWHEQKYGRGLFLQAKQKMLRMKAYEVPGEMMTMGVGPRPKVKLEKHEKEVHEEVREDIRPRSGDDLFPPTPRDDFEDDEQKGQSAGSAPFGYQPADSRDIMKLKKKLREIQKIEDSMSLGWTVEPNQVEKVTKKLQYLEELRVLESIVHAHVGNVLSS